ncbi:MAG: hypothetical protein ACRDJV_13050 [Actinomycetota bacterium]
MTAVAGGAILPHAPLLVPGVAGDALEPELHPIRSAARAIDFDGVDAIVVLSPHGEASGVYAQSKADLCAFGVPDSAIEWRTDDDLVRRLAAAWEVDVLDGPVDHGVAVPVALSRPAVPVIGACLPEGTGVSESAMRFAQALGHSSGEATLAFVASVNTSAGLTPRAPFTELPGARAIEARLRTALEDDSGRVDGVVTELEAVGRSCGAGPLAVFGALFSGRAATVAAHEWPVGVGYMVATVGT